MSVTQVDLWVAGIIAGLILIVGLALWLAARGR
jgi:hypothetical protein